MNEIERLRAALSEIRNKVHAHNRGGEIYAGLRETIRGICDRALTQGTEVQRTSDREHRGGEK